MSPSLVQRGPFCNYYVHEEKDEGIMVETDVPVKEVSTFPRKRARISGPTFTNMSLLTLTPVEGV